MMLMPGYNKRGRRRLSRSQCVCITLLWALLCYVVLTTAPRIDGPVILMIVHSGALVFIPVVKALRKD